MIKKQKWIFGYGSLIIPDGLNHRGMHREYADTDLHPAQLSGYRRAWEAISRYNGALYLGISPLEGSTVNGVIFQISDEDLIPFIRSEDADGKNPSYLINDVTKQVNVWSGFTGQIYTCVTRVPKNEGHIIPWYQKRVEEGLQHRGPEFREEFFRTTDWSAFRDQKIISAWQAELVGQG